MWIAASDRLPPLLTEVLGWHKDDRVRSWFRHSGHPKGAPYWETWSPMDRECDDCGVKEPSHWMDMPDPPGRAWVSVGDRLPNDCDTVWAFDGTDVFMSEYWGEHACFRDCGSSYDYEGLNSDPIFGITHWMDIAVPEPPK